MVKLFKNNEKEAIVEKQEVEVKEKTTKELVEEIHETFFTEVDSLLAEAKIMKSTETQKQELIDKTAKLKELGFTNTKECKEADDEIERLGKIERENNTKQEMIDAINYFSVKYPLYKFITEESVKKICKKYNLVYGQVSNYIGTVPDKNIKQMQEFKINKDDECYFKVDYRRDSWNNETKIMSERFMNLDSYKKYKENMYNAIMSISSRGWTDTGKCPLEIAAPIKDFNTTNMELEDYKLKEKVQIPDPVVLQPIFYEGKKHYLIVTAWGDEASDPLVVNEINN
jgi:hypothetical protein